MALSLDDCWNRIGVRGDGSCGELAQRGHCRNCPTYSAAASELLNRELAESDLADEAYATAPAEARARAAENSAVVFRIGAEWLALPAALFDEIAEQRPIRCLPHRRGGALLGLANVGGELIACLSLATLLGLETEAWRDAAPEGQRRRRLVILRHVEGRLAFPVDEVQTLHGYAGDDLRDVPTTLAKAANNYAVGVLGWSGRMVGHLDGERVLDALNRSIS